MDLRPLGIAIALLGLGSSIVLTELQVQAEGMITASKPATPITITLKPSGQRAASKLAPELRPTKEVQPKLVNLAQ